MTFVHPTQLWLRTAVPQPLQCNAEPATQASSPASDGPPTPTDPSYLLQPAACDVQQYLADHNGMTYAPTTDLAMTAYDCAQYPAPSYAQVYHPYSYSIVPYAHPLAVFPVGTAAVNVAFQSASQMAHGMHPSMPLGVLPQQYAPVSVEAPPSVDMLPPAVAEGPIQPPALYAPVAQPCHSAVLSWQPSLEQDGASYVHPAAYDAQPALPIQCPVVPPVPSIDTYATASHPMPTIDPSSALPLPPPGTGAATYSDDQGTPAVDAGSPFSVVQPSVTRPSSPSAYPLLSSQASGCVVATPDNSPLHSRSSSMSDVSVAAPPYATPSAAAPAATARAGQKRAREDDDDEGEDVFGAVRMLRASDVEIVRQRRAEMVETLGFTPTDPEKISAHDRKRLYVESMEQYVTFLHEQLRIVGHAPVIFEAVSQRKGLSSRSARTMTVYLKDTVRTIHQKVLEEERIFLDMRARHTSLSQASASRLKRHRSGAL